MPPLSFDWDIFISYAHLDNAHFSDIPQGWIEYLHERLDVRLAQLLGKPPRIWRDRKLAGIDVFNDTIKEQLAKTVIFLPVLSPRYCESPACRAEVEDFTRFAKEQGSIRVGTRQRVCKVVKTDIPHEAHPAQWQGLLGHEFYEKDPASGHVREFDHLLIGNQRDKRYWDELEDLADDIKETLLLLQNAPSSRPSSGVTVYLAETTSDLTAERDNLKRETTSNVRDNLKREPFPGAKAPGYRAAPAQAGFQPPSG